MGNPLTLALFSATIPTFALNAGGWRGQVTPARPRKVEARPKETQVWRWRHLPEKPCVDGTLERIPGSSIRYICSNLR